MLPYSEQKASLIRVFTGRLLRVLIVRSTGSANTPGAADVRHHCIFVGFDLVIPDSSCFQWFYRSDCAQRVHGNL